MRDEANAIRDERVESTSEYPVTDASSRRTFMKAAGASVVVGFGASVAGVASGDAPELPPLARDGNRIVDPSCNDVILRGVNIADPARQSRSWRGQTALETVDLATDEEAGWENRILRVACQPQDIAAGTADTTPEEMPHGDEWGPVLPGAFDRSDLEWYCDRFLDPLVDRGRERGVYVMLDYHRHYSVFHQEEYGQVDVLDVSWVCQSDGDEDWRFPEICGERGVLWHGDDQREQIWRLIDRQNLLDRFELAEDDIYLEPPEVTTALDEEVRLFWEVVADRYAEETHVLFDVYSDPTGPYGGDWGGVTRMWTLPGYLLSQDEFDELFDPAIDHNEAWWDLWRERAQPWVDTVEAHAPGHVVTIGSPRWCQYTYWAPYNEFDAENMCYSGHAFTQTEVRPLEEYFGEPAETVPVFFSAFGWLGYDNPGPTAWMDGETDEFAAEFEAFLEAYPVHPQASCFDIVRDPAFFDEGASLDGEWELRAREESPGRWWKSYLAEKAGDRDDPVAGSERRRGRSPDADTDENGFHVGPPTDLDTGGRVGSHHESDGVRRLRW